MKCLGMISARKKPVLLLLVVIPPLLYQRLLFVGCLTSQQHASVSQGRICPDNFTCCHTEIEVADQTFHLTQSQYTDTGPTWQGSHWSANFEVTGIARPRKNLGASGIRTRDALITRPTRRSALEEERRHQAQSARERRHLAASVPATTANFQCPVCARPCKSRIIIIMALKGTIRDFLQSPHCAANRLQHVHSSGPGAIVFKSRANTSSAYHV